ncbi:unnamed protein product [Ectocarpus sp. 8 AP-2014]
MFEVDVEDPTGAEDDEEEEDGENGEVRHGTMREGAGNTMKAEAEKNSTQSACCPWGRHRKHRKPPSNPPGWSEGKSTAYDVAQRPNRVVVINAEQETEFASNMVRTAKYEYYDFLPRFLWEEFNPATKIANVYFLFIAGLQVIPSITNTFGIPLMLLPLFFVVCVDAIFMIFEDIARHRADRHANSSLTRAWDRRSGEFKYIAWKEIEVGDLIVINNREPIPCDVLIMGVDEPISQSPAGVAYVETKSLDGETNLKIRQVVKGVVGKLLSPEDCAKLSGRVVMEHPDKLINNFKGKLLLQWRNKKRSPKTSGSPVSNAGLGKPVVYNTEQQQTAAAAAADGGERDNRGYGGEEKAEQAVRVEDGADQEGVEGVEGAFASEPISADMLLLRGCVLRNTRWVLGLVLNTGPDTKIMMSMSKAPSKASHLSSRINEEIKRVAAVMGSICILGAMLTTLWNAQYQTSKPYLRFDSASDSLAGMFFTQFLYNALLLNSFIPISLYVSMNFVRFLQSWFMNQDLDMYHADSDTPTRVRTMNLNEDLGQVSHIFSDKTGTLTCNIMDFRKFSVGGVSYGLGITEIGRAAMLVEGEKVPADVLMAEEKAKDHAVPHVNFYDPSVYQDLQGKGERGQDQARKIKDFFTALALCHTVIPERFEDTDEVMLSASSPDDEALVLGAKYFGFEFVNRIDSSAILHTWDVSTPPSLPTCFRKGRSEGGSIGTSTSGRSSHGGSSSGSHRSRRSGSGDGSTRNSRNGHTATTASAAEPLLVDPKSVVINSSSREEEGGGEGGDDPGVTGEQTALGVGGLVEGVAGGDHDEGKPQVNRVSYEVLHVLGFTSDRKRMSVIVRTEDGTIKIICKGADTTMLPRLRTDFPGAKKSIDETVRHMDIYAREGLRTLVVAQAELDPVAFAKWEESYQKVSNDLVEMDKRNKGEPNRIEDCMELIEANLEILGSSAIEDKLQAGVAGAVSDLMAAGIKIWVLTGDKEETAINIAVACQLLWTEARMHRTVIKLKGTGKSETEDIKEALEDFLSMYVEERNRFDADDTGKVAPPLPRGLIIDGPALLEAMQTPDSQGALLRAAQTCHSVIGCRLSPDQKRALVALVRENVPGTRTLSIGDGANDVPMIQRAHIGVGISGQEGMQAVNSSDYAIAQFAYLRKLLLVHGRWNYRRSSRVVCYLFYKSVMFACPLIFYAYSNGFSGTLFYDYVTCNMYAIVFTALPILLYGTYDRDISAETCLRYPQLYAYGITDRCMRPMIFWSWMLQARAVLESAFLTIAPVLLLSGDTREMGVVTSTYDYGTLTFSLVVIQVTLKMFWVQYRWTRIHVLVMAVSIYAFFLSSFLVNAWVPINWDYHGVFYALLQSKPYWAVMIWCLVVVVGRDWASKFHHRWWRPRLHHLMLESDKRVMNERGKAVPEQGWSNSTDGQGTSAGGGGKGGAHGDSETPTTPSEHTPSPDAVASGNAAAVGGHDSPGETGDGNRRRQSAIYASLFHRHKHRRSNTTGQQERPDPPSDEQGRRRHRPGRSGVGSLLDDDVSVRVLLEETFSPAGHAASGSIAFAPVPINALSETLRERRDIRNGNAGGGIANHNFTARNPFSVTMPSIGGRHARGVSSTAADASRRDGGSGGFSRTVGFGDAARDKGGPDRGVTADGDGDDEEWDPFAGGLSAAGAEGVSNAQEDNDDCGPAPRRETLVRTKSRQLLHAGGRAGCDPREASKLMRKASYFVDVDEGAPLPPTAVPGDLQRWRNSERGASGKPSAVPVFSSSGMYRRLSRVAGVSDARRSSGGGDLCAAEGRRRSSMSAAVTTTTNGTGLASNKTAATTTDKSRPQLSPLCSPGGFAFSCDAKAQLAEIAMILGKRTGPMPRTAASLAPPNSSTLPRSVQDGGGGDGGGGGLEGDNNTWENLPPLHRPSSAVGAGLNLGPGLALTRRFSQPSPDTPADVVEEEDGGNDGDGGEGVEEKKEEGRAGLNEREEADQR